MTRTLQTPLSPASSGRNSDQGATQVAFKIGGISFGIFSQSRALLALDPGLRDFAIDSARHPDPYDVNISVSVVDKLPPPVLKPIFHSGGLWSLFEESLEGREGYRFNFQRAYPGETPYKTV